MNHQLNRIYFCQPTLSYYRLPIVIFLSIKDALYLCTVTSF